MNHSKEMLTLKLSRPHEAWDHWKCGLGRTPVRAVVREVIEEVRTHPKALAELKRRCKQVRELSAASPIDPPDPSEAVVIDIPLPGADWIEVCQLIGELDTSVHDGPVSDQELLAAVILER